MAARNQSRPIKSLQKKVEEKQVNQVALTDLETEREEIVQSERDSHEGGKLVNICVSHFLLILWNDLIEEYLFMECLKQGRCRSFFLSL